MIKIDSMDFPDKANEKAKIVLRKVIAPNNYAIESDFRRIENKIGDKTRALLNNYTRAIMQILGAVCECIVTETRVFYPLFI